MPLSCDSVEMLTLHERLEYLTRLPAPVDRRRIRKEAGLTLRHLESVLEVSLNAIGQWERGVRVPTDRNLVMYVELLDRLAAHVSGETPIVGVRAPNCL